MASNYATSVTWDGHELHDLFVVEQIERPVMGGGSPVTQAIGMTDGVALVGTRYDAPKVTLTLACVKDSPEEIRQAWATLAGWLHVDGERVLAFGDDDGWFYSALPQGGVETTLLGWYGERAKVTFLVPDARMHALASISRSDVTTVTVDVPAGRCPVEPTIRMAPATPTDGVFVLTATCGSDVRTMTIPMAQAGELIVYCEAHQASAGGEPAMVSLDEDFFSLGEGTWTIERPAGHTGTLTVAWRPARWC